MIKSDSGNEKTMDDLDRRILTELQEHFPLELNPYEILAKNIGIDVDILWGRVLKLVESGVIRRIGLSIDSRKIGYASTLAAIQVLPDQINKASQLIDAYPEITHSYLRDDAYNIWFTVIAEDRKRITAILDELRMELDLSEDDLMDLPVETLFKLDARFR